MIQSRTPTPFTQKLRKNGTISFFILPCLLTLLALVLYPFCYGIYISFFKTNGQPNGILLAENFADAFADQPCMPRCG